MTATDHANTDDFDPKYEVPLVSPWTPAPPTAADHANTVRRNARSHHELRPHGQGPKHADGCPACAFNAALDALEAQAKDAEKDGRGFDLAIDRYQAEQQRAEAAEAERDEHAETIRCMGEWLDEANQRAKAAEADNTRLREALGLIADPDGPHTRRAREIARAALATDRTEEAP